MGELIFPANIVNLENPAEGKPITSELQDQVEGQFGLIPEFHRLYGPTMVCRVTRYDPNEGYIRFQSIASTDGDMTARRFFSFGGDVTEYQLLDPQTKDRASRSAFFTKDWEGRVELDSAEVYYRRGLLDTAYKVEYGEADFGIRPARASVVISYNQSKDLGVLYPYTDLVKAYRNEVKPWEVYVAHGTFEGLEESYRKQRAQYFRTVSPTLSDIRHLFPGVCLKLPIEGSEVLVYEGIQEAMAVMQEPRKIDTLTLGIPKEIIHQGRYLYRVGAGKNVSIKRVDKDNSNNKPVWEIALFNSGINELDAAIKGDWVNLRNNFPADLLVK